MASTDDTESAPAGAEGRAESLFLRAQEEGVELDELIGRHPDLRAELLEIAEQWSWLEAHREGNRLPDDLVAALRAPDARYRRGPSIGSGGMGTVWRARDTHLDRDLAMKVSASRQRRGTPGRPPARSRGVYRLLDEARVMGQLDHPGVLPVHDVGLDDDGHAWFTMDLVEGQDLNAVLKEARRSGALPEDFRLPRLIRILVQVAETVAFAHERGVLHRDLKPHNVMVGRFGQVHVMDWGLARVDAGRAPGAERPPSMRRAGDEELLTVDGDVIGTPAYMAPEQATPGGRVDERTDVYSMGALLYHVLAGRAPYAEGASSAAGGTGTILDAVRSGPPAGLALVAPDAPAELVAVAERAMSRQPAKRYGSMLELRDDLLAWADGRPVAAASPGLWTHAVKWARRNRLAAAAALLALASAVIGTALTLRAERHRTRDARTKNAELELERAATRKEARRAGAVAFAASMDAARSALDRGSAREARRVLDGIPPGDRDWVWDLVAQEVDRADVVLTPADGEPLGELASDPGTGRLAVAVGGDVIVLHPAAPGERLRLRACTGEVSALAFHPWTGALAIGGAQGEVALWAPGSTSFEPLESRVPGRRDVTLAFVPWSDSLWIASWLGGTVEMIREVSDPAGRRLVTGPRRSARRIVPRPGTSEVLLQSFDGATLVDGRSGESLRMHEVPLGTAERLAPLGPHRCAFSRDGSTLYMTDGEGSLLALDPDSGAQAASWPLPRIPVDRISVHPSEGRIALMGASPSVALLEADGAPEPTWATGHGGRVTGMAWSPGGSQLWTSARDGSLRRFDAARLRDRRVPSIATASLRTGLWLDARGDRCFVTGREERVFAVDLTDGAVTSLPQGRPHRFSRIVALDLDAERGVLRAVSQSPRVNALRWDLDAGGRPTSREIGVHFAHGAHFEGTGAIWAAMEGPRLAGDLPGARAPVTLEFLARPRWTVVEGNLPACRAIVSLGSTLVAALDGGELAVLDPASDTVLARHQLPSDSITAAVLDDAGGTIACGSMSGEVLLVDAQTLAVRTTLEPMRTEVVALQWLEEGRRLLAADRRGELRVIDAELGLTILRARSSSRRLWTAAADAASGTIVAVGIAGLDVWRSDPGAVLRLPLPDVDRVAAMYAAPATRAEVLTLIDELRGSEPPEVIAALRITAHVDQPLCRFYEDHALELEQVDPDRARAMAEEALRMNEASTLARDVLTRLEGR